MNLPGDEGEEDFVQAVKIQRCLTAGEDCNIQASGFTSTVCRYRIIVLKLYRSFRPGACTIHYMHQDEMNGKVLKQ